MDVKLFASFWIFTVALLCTWLDCADSESRPSKTYSKRHHCPVDVVTAAFQCLYGLTSHTGSDRELEAGSDIEHIRQKCSDDSFAQTLGCFRTLQMSCTSPEKVHLLSQLVDVCAMTTAFTQFCVNMEEYITKSNCIHSYNPSIQACIKTRFSSYLMRNTFVNSTTDKLRTVCGFLRGMTNCIDKYVRFYCDAHLSQILVAFMEGFTPPYCRPYSLVGDADGLGSTAQTTKSSCLLLLAGLTIVIPFLSKLLWNMFISNINIVPHR